MSLTTGARKPLPRLPRNGFAGWLADSKGFLVRLSESPVQIARLDVATGAQTPVAIITVSDPANYFRVLSELYIIDGLK